MDRKLPRTTPMEPADSQFWLTRVVEARQNRADDTTEPEWRLSLRRSVPLYAVINYGVTYSAAWHVRDLSLTGTFIDVGAPGPAPGTYVEVVLRYNYRDQARPTELRIPAIVVSSQAEGTALAFERYDDDVYTELVKLLYAL